MKTHEENLSMARRLASEVEKAGGKAYFVGGYVRDLLSGHPGKDIDIEVHGLESSELEKILSGLGECMTTGLNFGIYTLRHYDLDIAMPRKETATGRGHRDFQVYTDPFITPEKAACRRDFTVNAMMQDVLTGEILDFFDGQTHLKQKLLRHVKAESFIEDPLRVLRGAQFAARFGFTPDNETISLCRSMDLTALPRERIMGELEKALLKAEAPSVFFRILREANGLSFWFPELSALIGLEQEMRFHPEGDVWNHTMLVLDAAAGLRSKAKEPLYFMFAALCHDLGKADTTALVDGRIRSLGHEEAGKARAESLLSRLSGEVRLKQYVINMTELHMLPNILAKQNAGEKAMNRFFDRSVCPEDLLLLAKADRFGQLIPGDYAPTEQFLLASLSAYRDIMAKPFVMGRDLVEAGFNPGEGFKEALAYAHMLRLAGVEKEKALPQVMALLRKGR